LNCAHSFDYPVTQNHGILECRAGPALRINAFVHLARFFPALCTFGVKWSVAAPVRLFFSAFCEPAKTME
jgi:hypothetical protein